jgi:broad specificity phosphatase PhoE
MGTVFFITHPDVVIDPTMPVTSWPLSARGHARMHACLRQPSVRGIRRIVCSQERKAIDSAMILDGGVGIGFTTLAGLGENDRSATGYLPRVEFEAVADQFFAFPEQSIRGWERAADAQRRIVRAFETVLALSIPDTDTAIVSHGAVGALLICHLEGVPISRAEDQPAGSGGYYYAIDPQRRLLRHGWTPIDAQ